MDAADDLEFELAADIRLNPGATAQNRELRDDYDLGGNRDEGIAPEPEEFH